MSENIWWSKISGAVNFSNDIIRAIANDESVIINNRTVIPFFDTLMCKVEESISKTTSDKNIDRFSAYDIDTDNIALHMINNYCPGSIYVPRKNFSEFDFLASADDFMYNNSVLIVYGIPPEMECRWVEFVSNYCRASNKRFSKAQFILIINSKKDIKKAKQCRILDFSNYVTDYDYYVYCLLSLSENTKYNISMKQYVAEIASLLCRNNAELSWGALDKPEELYSNSFEYFNSFSTKKMSQNEINQILWKAQIKYIFPILEDYRCCLVSKYGNILKDYLPFELVYGDTVDDVNELELSHILYINKESDFLKKTELDRLVHFKDIRNDLAHMKPTSADKISKILSETTGKY